MWLNMHDLHLLGNSMLMSQGKQRLRKIAPKNKWTPKYKDISIYILEGSKFLQIAVYINTLHWLPKHCRQQCCVHFKLGRKRTNVGATNNCHWGECFVGTILHKRITFLISPSLRRQKTCAQDRVNAYSLLTRVSELWH